MKKTLTPREKKFAWAIAQGATSVQAYRKVYNAKCEPYTPEYNRATELARSARVKFAIEEAKKDLEKRAEMETLAGKATPSWDSIYQFAFARLKQIRDDPTSTARTRLRAIEVLEQIQDPTQDINLIWRFVDTVWEGLLAHCPCCHKDFPLWQVANPRLTEWRRDNTERPDAETHPTTDLERRLLLMRRAEKRKDPHKGQVQALESPERHVVGQGPARSGKSVCLAMFGFLFMLIPGAETWILARIYDDAQTELDTITRYLSTAFYPVDKHMFQSVYDKKTGEAYIQTRWGAVLRVKSGKSKGSITGRELEGILVAEPGWVDGDLFEEVRARMSSRLGRIIALGSPKGFGGFLGRLTRLTTRDMRTGKRLTPGARLVKNGCPWSQSIFQYVMTPKDNPEYVISELAAAKGELTEAEYASEFEGRMVGDAGLKFPYITDSLLVQIPRDAYRESMFVLGVDQGEKNFAACLLAWDGEVIRVCWEYFDNSENTIKANLLHINQTLPPIIYTLGGQPENWKLTIFDADPKIDHQLYEMEREHRAWKTDFTLRPKNTVDTANWRQETCLWINEMAKEGRLLFAIDRCDFLHEQLKEALILDEPDDTDAINNRRKRWKIHDPIRKDHVADAFLEACWTIYSNAVLIPQKAPAAYGVVDEQRRAYEFQRLLSERRDLGQKVDEEQLFRDLFGRNRFGDSQATQERLSISGRGYWDDY